MRAQDYQISAEKFVFRSSDVAIHDQKLETKPVTYFRDAFNRFTRNKGSIFAFFVIMLLVIFAIIGPIISPYAISYEDINYANARPRLEIMVEKNIPFWDGGRLIEDTNATTYNYYRYIEMETGAKIIMDSQPVEYRHEEYMKKEFDFYTFRLDTYAAVGMEWINLSDEEYLALQEYQTKNEIQIIYPYVDKRYEGAKANIAQQDANDANFWYRTKIGKGNKTEIVYSRLTGELIPDYMEDNGKDMYTSKLYESNGLTAEKGGVKEYTYAVNKSGRWYMRVDYAKYYAYKHAGDRYSSASHIFGADGTGRDVFVRLSSGARFSFILAIIVSSFNLVVGAIYGAIEGYYGGKVDLIMERIIDLLSSIPFMIVITLLKYYLKTSDLIILFISFFLTGWTGMAGRTRMQFYRFKNQEYVLVAKTLGAKDKRVMFKHIFPNAIGTLITGSVLVIPGVIFSETSLSYLNIIDLNGPNMTSVGTMLSKGQGALYTNPHILLFPSIFISLLMLSFNLFGNGLRDAFNPSLRGTE